ncbi:MAG: hypothetical protein ACLFTR_03365 [Candidatus Woesearchaeota archaeon]
MRKKIMKIRREGKLNESDFFYSVMIGLTLAGLLSLAFWDIQRGTIILFTAGCIFNMILCWNFMMEGIKALKKKSDR